MNMRIIRKSWDRAALFDVCAVNSKSTHSTVKQSPKKCREEKITRRPVATVTTKASLLNHLEIEQQIVQSVFPLTHKVNVSCCVPFVKTLSVSA